ncbi:hypothetical protein NCCP2495_14330 [Dietzia sp. NCCP-2495]|nr:hypothetical protein NCCP2495_14330 [Dietzia sp. NCCP-2495]
MSMNGVAMSDVPKPVAPPMIEATAMHTAAIAISSTRMPYLVVVVVVVRVVLVHPTRTVR